MMHLFWAWSTLRSSGLLCLALSRLMAQFMWKMLPILILILILKIEFVHFWWQKCGCCWSMVQSYMPKSVPSCLIILSNQPIFHYVMRLMYQIFILSVYHYFTTKTCCYVKVLGFSAIDWSGLLEFGIQDWENCWDIFLAVHNADGADISVKKMFVKERSATFWFKWIYRQNVHVNGRFFNKKWINYVSLMKKCRIIKIFVDFD